MVLTEKFVERVKPAAKRLTYRDDEVTGFGLRIQPAPNGRKSFFYNAKIAGRVVFKALGEWPAVSVKDARDEAKELVGKVSPWKKQGCSEEASPFAKPKPVVRTTVPTFDELVEAYITNHLLDAEVGALNPARAEYDVRLLVKNHLDAWRETPVDKITPEHVLAAKNAAKGRYIQNSVVEFVRRVFTWSAGKKGSGVNFWTVGNPAKDIELHKPKRRQRFLQPEELVRFKEELAKEKHADTRDALALLLSTGARKSSVYAMRWENVDLDLANWHVPVSKNGDSYEVPLTDAAIEVLERRKRERREGEPFVFPASSKSGHISDIKKRWLEFRKRAGLGDVRLHDLRRTRGSYAALSGQSLQQIALMLGHKSLGSTQIYARLNEESAKETTAASEAKMAEVIRVAKRRVKKEARKAKRRVKKARKPKVRAVTNG